MLRKWENNARTGERCGNGATMRGQESGAGIDAASFPYRSLTHYLCFCIFCSVLLCAFVLILFSNISYAEFSIGLPGVIKERIKKLDQRIMNQPLISSLAAMPVTLSPAGTSTITCTTIDPNNNSLIYTWASNAGTITGSGSQVVWISPQTAGTYTVSCEVSNGRGRTSRGSVDVAVSNQLPIISSLIANPADVVPSGASTITCTAYDSNNDALVYTWTCATSTITGTGSQAAWIAPSSIGTYTVRCMVSDGKGGIAQKDIQMTVVMGVNHLPAIGSLAAMP
ncbi:MAG: hypothetical protein AAB110_04310, partial [Candidatus Desantisbacteria bacterium]